MDPILVALWGLLGSAALEGLQFVADGRRVGDWPWRAKDSPGKGFIFCAVLVRVAVGAVVAGALGASNQIDTAIGALLAGVSAPLMVEKAAAAGNAVIASREAPDTAGADADR